MSVFTLCLGQTACVTTVIVPAGNLSETYFGVVRVEAASTTHNTPAPVVSITTTSIGARFQQGFGVGAFHVRELSIPMDCRVVVLVRTAEQLRYAADRLSPTLENVCISLDRSL